MGRIKQAEAARRLGVNRSTVSRWVKESPALADADGLVDVAELEAYCQTVKHPGNRTKVAAAASALRIEADRDDAAPEPRPDLQPAPRGADGATALNTHRARTEEAKAVGAELDLAERLQQTLRRSDVERALADAANAIRQRAAQLARDRAERLALIDDVRAMESALDDMMRDLLNGTADALAKAAQGETTADAA